MVEVKDWDVVRSDDGGEARAEEIEPTCEVVVIGAVAPEVLVVAIDRPELGNANGVMPAEELGLVGLDEVEPRGSMGSKQKLPFKATLAPGEVSSIGVRGERAEGTGRARAQEPLGGERRGTGPVEVNAGREDQTGARVREGAVGGDGRRGKGGITVDDENKVVIGEAAGVFKSTEAVVADLVESGCTLMGAERMEQCA